MKNRGVQCASCLRRIAGTKLANQRRQCGCGRLAVTRSTEATNLFRIVQNKSMWRNTPIDKRAPVIFDEDSIPSVVKQYRYGSPDPTYQVCDFPPDAVFIFISQKLDTLVGKQKLGYRADEHGHPNARKRYWVSFHSNGVDLVLFRWLARIPRKVQEVRQLEYDAESFPVGKINWKRARRNLNKAIARLELSYLDAVKLIKLNDKVPTACWFFDNETGREGIYIHPILAQKSAVYAEYIIKHEVMHRALFRGMRDCKDLELRNIALDVCVNNVLARNVTSTRNKRALTSMRWLYPSESRKNIVALANGSLSSKELGDLHPDVQKLWSEMWGRFVGDAFADKTMPPLTTVMPLSIYYRIRQIVANGNGGKQIQLQDKDGEPAFTWGNPFGPGRGENPDASKIRNPDNEEISTRAGEAMEKQVKDNVLSGGRRPSLRSMARAKQFSRQASELSKLADWWDTNVMSLDEINAKAIESLIKKMRTVHLIETAKARILHHIRPRVRQDPFPMELTDDGVMYVACGLCPPKFPFFENSETANAKKRITVYFDLSPSMRDVLGHIPQILDVIETRCSVEFVTGHKVNERGAFVFAGDIAPIGPEEIEKMRHGRVGIVGNSTCFDKVMEHAIEQINTNNVDIILVVTDMESAISDQNIIDFNCTQKKCFTIGLVEEGTLNAKNASKTLERSGLTRLNGECTILDLPKHEG